MRVIFLDVDGVLNTHDTFRRVSSDLYLRRELSNVVLDHDCMKQLRFIVDATQAVVVLSSTWRIRAAGTRHRVAIHAVLDSWGIPVIGQTPVSGARHRGVEIEAWLKSTKHSVESYVVLDDSSEHLSPEHVKRLVQTSMDHGLTQEAATRAVEIVVSTKSHVLPPGGHDET